MPSAPRQAKVRSTHVDKKFTGSDEAPAAAGSKRDRPAMKLA
jgi:hypothetical protein|tara:strand:+ start:2193 stop:2318 length:126 start_codon:yes stop_codon:yes gene_type:complete